MKKKEDLIYPDLSYEIIGCLFEVFKNLGAGHREKYYQNAVRQEFIKRKISFQEQIAVNLKYDNIKIGINFLDFLIDNKIVLELKSGNYYQKQNLEQILSYLKITGLKLGIIANFTRDGVKYYRVVNIR
ncbi:MAG: hypothetical protein US94_C0006G0002 [Berkelbacteria bacterium GW2011_GWB1_38_5]|uniref:GxxExxY protein n=2 Tax=Candidatus Berkelbacteria TaxID=1618330 RepID=A0A0G0LI05_9BACT|nr:MAG: hypothetical protein US94_C0006G0002 [Berkelbacteria bacterium GW2011_GWB1_38_5]KKQ90672.1 MAG: hypothetical protein UT15_C0007G0004 [Berkelbacteria bacterium GW2011_GWA1_39_10]